MEQLKFVMAQYGIKPLKEEEYDITHLLKNHFEFETEKSVNELTESQLNALAAKLLMGFTRRASNPLVIADVPLFKKRNGHFKSVEALPEPLLTRMRFDYLELRKGVGTVMTTSTGLHTYGLRETFGTDAEEIIECVFQDLPERDRIKGTFYERDKSNLVENHLKNLLNAAYLDLNNGPAIIHLTQELLVAVKRMIAKG